MTDTDSAEWPPLPHQIRLTCGYLFVQTDGQWVGGGGGVGGGEGKGWMWGLDARNIFLIKSVCVCGVGVVGWWGGGVVEGVGWVVCGGD